MGNESLRFLIELALRPGADAVGLGVAARRIQSSALAVEGIAAAKNVASRRVGPDRLLLSISCEMVDRAVGLASIMSVWSGIEGSSVSALVDLEPTVAALLGSADSPPEIPGG